MLVMEDLGAHIHEAHPHELLPARSHPTISGHLQYRATVEAEAMANVNAKYREADKAYFRRYFYARSNSRGGGAWIETG